MYTRGQFSVIAKVGRKALRLYEEKGILVPAKLGAENGYHYYEEEQLEDLFRILQYKKYGLSLDEIAEIMVHGADEKELLQEHHVMLSQKIQDELVLKKQLEKQLSSEDNETTEEYLFDKIDFPSTMVLSRQETMDKEHIGIPVGKLWEVAVKNHLTVSGAHFVRYEQLFNTQDVYSMKVCLPVRETDGENCTIEDILESHCLHTVHRTGFSTVGLAHQALLAYAKEHKIPLTGTTTEVYQADHSVDLYYEIED